MQVMVNFKRIALCMAGSSKYKINSTTVLTLEFFFLHLKILIVVNDRLNEHWI